MAWPWRASREAMRLTTRTALVIGAAQVAAAVGVVTVDALRKKRDAPTGFSATDPLEVGVAGSALTTYTTGRDLFPAMLEAIERATDRIYFETYIWKDDDIGRQFKRALVDADARGVRVFIVFDGFANLVVPSRFFRDLPESIQVLRFRVVAPKLVPHLRNLGRDHRKILVVDGRVAFVGGYNVGDDYATRWRDTHVKVTGDAVWELEDAFVDFWNDHRRRGQAALPDVGAARWLPHVRAAENAPSRMLFPVRGLYLDAIDRASHRIYITQAYFIPDVDIVGALLAAARRGVDVRILVPERSNHILADWVSRGFYAELLRGGVTIWLYQNAMVHAKTATVDGRWSTIGTANIDRLSLLGNYEINLEVYSDDQAAHMEAVFRQDLANARRLSLDEWEERGWLPRLVERLLAPWYPFL